MAVRTDGHAGVDTKHSRLLPSSRLFTALLIGLGLTTALITRNNLNIAVICMVADNHTTPDATAVDTDAAASDVIRTERDVTQHRQSNSALVAAGRGDGVSNDTGDPLVSVLNNQGEFHWDKSFRALLLSAYYYGYSANLAPGGMLADRLPASWVLLFCVAMEGLLNQLLPTVARANKYLLVALRVLMGANASAMFPASTVLLRNWSLPAEYSTLFGIVWSLVYVGGASAFPISGALCGAAGWSAVFYVTGALPIVWALVGWLLLSNTPEESRMCSQNEADFILSRRAYQVTTKHTLKDSSERRRRLPLWSLVTNRQVLIIGFCHFWYCWFYYSVNINMPVFLKETMGVNLSENGVLSSLPVLSMAVGVLFGGKALHLLVARWKFSHTNARRIVNSVGTLVPAVCVCVKIFLPAGSKYATMALMSCASSTAVLMVSGGPISAGPEIGPEYAGAIWGITASFGNLPGILTPIVAAAMTPNQSLSEWRSFFLITVVMLTITSLVVLLFWRSEIQHFSDAHSQHRQQPPQQQQLEQSTVKSATGEVNGAFTSGEDLV